MNQCQKDEIDESAEFAIGRHTHRPCTFNSLVVAVALLHHRRNTMRATTHTATSPRGQAASLSTEIYDELDSTLKYETAASETNIPVVIFALGILALSPLLFAQDTRPNPFSPYVDADGEIRRPKEYRDEWAHLGTYIVLNESEDGHGLHEVYTQRANIEAYKKTGEWPDGATIVKEVRHTGGTRMTTGDSHWGTDINVWFVMVKDRQGRYPNNPIWGEGWGWALFKGSNPEEQVATDYKSDCLGCHIPAKGNDWVYVEGYPLLRNDPFAAPSVAPKKAAESPQTAMEQVQADPGSAQRGAQLFASTCKACHNTDSIRRKAGPGLAGVARGKLPTGKDASRENILKQINEGGNGMPPFGDKLSSLEKDDLVTYVTTL
jgi:mono/diheme cytochrome c family protein